MEFLENFNGIKFIGGGKVYNGKLGKSINSGQIKIYTNEKI